MRTYFLGEDGSNATVSHLQPFPMVFKGNNLRRTLVGADINFAFLDSASADTQDMVTVAQPTKSVLEYEFLVYHPSIVTDLTVKLFQTELLLGGATRDVLVATLAIPKAATITGTVVNAYARFAQKIFNGGDLKIVVSNDAALSVANAFTSTIRIREVI
jgi:hypothetical protein